MTVRVTACYVTRLSALAAAAGLAGRSLRAPAGQKATRDPSWPGCLAADGPSDPQLARPVPLLLALYLSAAPRPAAAGYSPRSARSTVEARLSVPASESD